MSEALKRDLRDRAIARRMMLQGEAKPSRGVVADMQMAARDLRDLIAALRADGIARAGKIKFNVTERDEQGRVKSFEIDR